MSGLFCTLAHREAPGALVLLPSAGQTPLALVPLARGLPPTRTVHSFAWAGMDGGPAHGSVEEMARAYATELPAGPCLLGGYCFGGTVAFALAAELEAAGREVEGVVLLEAFAPIVAAGPVLPPPSLRAAVDDIFERMAAPFRALPPLLARRLEDALRGQLAAGGAYRAPAIRAPLSLLRSEAHPAELYSAWRRLAPAVDEVVLPGRPTLAAAEVGPWVEALRALL